MDALRVKEKKDLIDDVCVSLYQSEYYYQVLLRRCLSKAIVH